MLEQSLERAVFVFNISLQAHSVECIAVILPDKWAGWHDFSVYRSVYTHHNLPYCQRGQIHSPKYACIIKFSLYLWHFSHDKIYWAVYTLGNEANELFF